MKFSYSNISTFSQCPYRWYLRYKEKLKTLPETNADNALYLGLAIHAGIEKGSVDTAVAEYKSHFNIITDDNMNWIQQIEYQVPRVIDLLPSGGEHELKIDTDEYIGFVDYVCGDTLYDFKFSNNVDGYKASPQLSIYKHYIEQVRPDIKIKHLKYVFVPKILIRQKKTETIQQFRARLQEHLEASEIKIIEVNYNEDSVTDFKNCCKFVTQCKDFPKNPTKLCGWCQYQQYCESDGLIDWMIL